MDSLYLVDSGGQYLDGTTDITRTVAIGQVSAEMKQQFTLVLKGHIALLALASRKAQQVHNLMFWPDSTYGHKVTTTIMVLAMVSAIS